MLVADLEPRALGKKPGGVARLQALRVSSFGVAAIYIPRRLHVNIWYMPGP